MEMKEIKDMSEEELRSYLGELRLSRKTGYDKTPRARKSKAAELPDSLKGIDDDLAALILAELKEQK